MDELGVGAAFAPPPPHPAASVASSTIGATALDAILMAASLAVADCRIVAVRSQLHGAAYAHGRTRDQTVG